MSKKLLALLLCLLLMLGTTGCLEKSSDDTLPAFTLGDITVTVGEVRSNYNTIVEMMGYYGMAAPSTDEEIKQYRDMIIEDMLTAKVLPWKAQQMGIVLTPEKIEEVNRRVEEELAEYAADYLDDARAELGENASAADLALKAREYLEKDVENYFGYPFSQWLEEVRTSYMESALTELLQEKFYEGITVTEEQARAWFNSELEAQQESFTANYIAFKNRLESYQLGETDIPVLYTPEGFGRMQVIVFDMDPNDSAAYAANEVEMSNLEAEYGKLYLRGEDEDRQAEIVARYKELQAANAELIKKNSEKGEKARADALKGKEFTEIYSTYSGEGNDVGYFGYVKDDPKQDGTVVFYTKDKDTEWPEQIWTVAKDMKAGEVSELLHVGDSFYLIKRLDDLPSGAASFDDDPAAYTAAALAEKREQEWEAVQEDWINEARNAAVFYEENYADVGKQ